MILKAMSGIVSLPFRSKGVAAVAMTTLVVVLMRKTFPVEIDMVDGIFFIAFMVSVATMCGILAMIPRTTAKKPTSPNFVPYDRQTVVQLARLMYLPPFAAGDRVKFKYGPHGRGTVLRVGRLDVTVKWDSQAIADAAGDYAACTGSKPARVLVTADERFQVGDRVINKWRGENRKGAVLQIDGKAVMVQWDDVVGNCSYWADESSLAREG